MKWASGGSGEGEGVGEAEEAAGLGGGDASIGGEAVEVVEAGGGGPRGESGFAELREAFLKGFDGNAGVRIARRDRAAGAGIAALEAYFADGEADDAAFLFAEEAVFPEGGDAVDLESGAEAKAEVVDGKAGEPSGNGLERRGGDDGGAAGDGVIGKAAWGIAEDDLLLEENAEPFGGLFVGVGKGKVTWGDFAAVGWDGERDAGDIGRIAGADGMDERRPLAVHPFAVDRVEGPGAIEGETAGRGDVGFGDVDGIQ